MIGRNYLIIFIFAKMNFSVCITVYGTLDTTLTGRGCHNLLFRMRTCTLEPPGQGEACMAVGGACVTGGVRARYYVIW